MKDIKTKGGQNIPDLAVQEYGAFEAAIHLAVNNGKSITDDLPGGAILTPVDMVFNKTIAEFCKAHSVSPATNIQ